MQALPDSILELIRRTSAEIPDDVHRAIVNSLEQEKKGTIAESALKLIERNIQLAKQKSQPICQDTGSVIFYVECPIGFDQIAFEETACAAVTLATKKGFLRQNSVDSLTGKNDGTNVGPGAPAFHFHQHRTVETQVRLILKGGGCENVGAQYSLPEESLNANRDLNGCRKAILDAVLQAQGRGCGPGVLGVCIGEIAPPDTNSPRPSSSGFSTIAIPTRSSTPWSRTFSRPPTNWASVRWASAEKAPCWALRSAPQIACPPPTLSV